MYNPILNIVCTKHQQKYILHDELAISISRYYSK